MITRSLIAALLMFGGASVQVAAAIDRERLSVSQMASLGVIAIVLYFLAALLLAEIETK